MGHAASQLAWHMEAAVRVGARPSEVDQVQRIAVSYAGAPSAAPAGPALPLPAIDATTREIATVALLTAIATKPAELTAHIRAALDAGASRAQVIAAIEQMAVYAGFPAALNAVAVARDVFEGR
jgi:4-carboxymuconolactone decarboxylase